MINKTFLETLWKNRHGRIWVGDYTSGTFLDKEEVEYLVELCELTCFTDFDFVTNYDLLKAAKEGVRDGRDVRVVAKELKEDNAFNESIA